jgi:hypothetical protein
LPLYFVTEDRQYGGGVMGTVRRKRALLKKVTSFNLYADQWAQIQAIMEGSRAEKEAPVLRELIDEALGARRRKIRAPGPRGDSHGQLGSLSP